VRCRYETTNHLWLILEYCVGGDLMSLLRQDARLPESSTHDFGRDMVVALQFLHSNSIVHCDIKLANVLVELTSDGPVGVGVLAYSQSSDPASPHHADGTRAFAARALRPLRFTDADIDADPELRVVELRGARD
jgi:serine/threonine protein kinase